LAGQVRGQAWSFRNFVNAWTIAPDDDPWKQVMFDAISDALASWEGSRDIQGTAFTNTPMWNFGKQYKPVGASPLHWWDMTVGYNTGDTAIFNPAVAAGATAHWMNNWIITDLGEATRRGLPAGALFRWAVENVIGQTLDPAYNPYLQDQYVIPNLEWRVDPATGAKTIVPLESWAETMTAWAPARRTWKDFATHDIQANMVFAMGVGAYAAEILNRHDVWAKFDAMYAERAAAGKPRPNWGDDPRWRFVPRAK